MRLTQPAKLLRIYVSESDRYGGKPLYEAIVARCRELEVAGATVFRGDSRPPHPILITIVDTAERIEALLAAIEPMIATGRIAVSDVQIVRVQKVTAP